MGYYSHVYVGICLKITINNESWEKNGNVMDLTNEKFMQINGCWSSPKNDIYYFASNFNKPVFGWTASENDAEFGIELDFDKIGLMKRDFEEYFATEIAKLIRIFENVEVIFAMVKGGN